MSTYDECLEARIDRHDRSVSAAETKAQDLHAKARSMADRIPFGQPVLVGHYSEGRDRRFRDRIHSTFGKAFDAHAYATKLASRKIGTAGIASDDENAIQKLETKIVGIDAEHTELKAFNAATKKAGGTPQFHLLTQVNIDAYNQLLHVVPYQVSNGLFPGYMLTALTAERARCRKRIEALTALSNSGRVEYGDLEMVGWELTEDSGRYVLTFAERQPVDVVATVKQAGFVWSPSRDAWVRKITPNARHTVERLAHKLETDI
jgi:Domain of unknown function (DUF3560)